MFPPLSIALNARPRAGNLCGSGSLKDRLPTLAKSSFLVLSGSLSGKQRANWIGSLMSGSAIWAMTAPSSNSTIEWMIDSGWTTTLILSTGMSNSHFASITSKPLFIMVAESMVIFAPMSQFGCFRAMSFVALAMLSLSQVLNGPPDAVR